MHSPTMRHIALHLLKLCPAVSLVLCVLLCVLWVRSYLTFDSYLRMGYVPSGGNSATWWEYGVDSIRGTVQTPFVSQLGGIVSRRKRHVAGAGNVPAFRVLHRSANSFGVR